MAWPVLRRSKEDGERHRIHRAIHPIPLGLAPRSGVPKHRGNPSCLCLLGWSLIVLAPFARGNSLRLFLRIRPTTRVIEEVLHHPQRMDNEKWRSIPSRTKDSAAWYIFFPWIFLPPVFF